MGPQVVSVSSLNNTPSGGAVVFTRFMSAHFGLSVSGFPINLTATSSPLRSRKSLDE